MEPGELIAEVISANHTHRLRDSSIEPVTTQSILHRLGYKKPMKLERDLALYLRSLPDNHPHREGCRSFVRRRVPSEAMRVQVLNLIDAIIADPELVFPTFRELAQLLGFTETRLKRWDSELRGDTDMTGRVKESYQAYVAARAERFEMRFSNRYEALLLDAENDTLERSAGL